MSTDFVSTTLIPNTLAVLLFVTSLFVAVRSIYVYTQVLNPRLFTLGLSMSIISLTALADFISSNLTSVTLNTDWFLYIGQATSLLFIMLSLITTSTNYAQMLVRWHIIISVLLIALLLLSPTLPPFSNVAIKAILSGSRCVMCFGIFYAYITAFLKKQARFSLLMSIAFALLGFGYLMIAQQYFVADPTLFDNVGDITRMVGLVVLLTAIFAG